VTPVIEELFVTVEKPATAVKAMLMQQHQEGQQQQESQQQLERQQQQGRHQQYRGFRKKSDASNSRNAIEGTQKQYKKQGACQQQKRRHEEKGCHNRMNACKV
jgi:hypothetical protein